MRNVLISLTAASLLALSGCATQQQEAAKPAAPVISADAQTALTAAQAAVKEATAKDALWTTAQDSLKRAEEAAKVGKSEDVVKFATVAKQQAELGLKQKDYPVLQLKDL